MAYPSVYASGFQETCRRWLAEESEVLALFRYSRAAGARSYEIFTTYPALQERIGQFPPQTCVTVWGEFQLPLRGHVDKAFIARALEQIPDNQDWLLIGLDKMVYGAASWYRHNGGMSLTVLASELPECMGERIALGLEPEWSENGGKEVSAVVPEADGTVITGIY